MPTYTGISSEAFRHPLDRQAEQALRNLPGFDLIARKFVEFVYERPQLVYLMGNYHPSRAASIFHYLPDIPGMCARFGHLPRTGTVCLTKSPSK